MTMNDTVWERRLLHQPDVIEGKFRHCLINYTDLRLNQISSVLLQKLLKNLYYQKLVADIIVTAPSG